MKTLFFWLIVCIIGFSLPLLCSRLVNSGPSILGHVHFGKWTMREFLNKNCKENNSCDLNEFSIYTSEYKVWFSGDPEPTYGTSMQAEYKTDSVKNLKNYVIVQYIRGCVFDSWVYEGVVKKFIWYKKYQFGDSEFFCFPDWTIDSIDTDPVYYSSPDSDRHYFYSKTRRENSVGYYVQDWPLGAFKNRERSINNISLKFKTCIYRTSDVPKETTQDNVDFAVPIACHEWESSYIYNFVLGKFESKNEIDPFCLQNPSKK